MYCSIRIDLWTSFQEEIHVSIVINRLLEKGGASFYWRDLQYNPTMILVHVSMILVGVSVGVVCPPVFSGGSDEGRTEVPGGGGGGGGREEECCFSRQETCQVSVVLFQD